MIKGIEHTAIASNDIVKLGQWYVDTLGFVINYQSANAVFLKAENGTMIELIHAEGNRGDNEMKTPGMRHMALTVDDFESALGKLKDKAVDFVTEPANSNGNWVVFFRDPEGNILHLLKRAQPLP